MNVLVIGKGGREHALVWKLGQSPRVDQVFCAPGNAGTALDGMNVAIESYDFDGLIKFAKKESVALTVIGPEEPLARGIVDAFQKVGLAAGRQIIIEKRLDGQELSILALVADRAIVPLAPSQDHKRALDNDQGPNTGGMGAYCPAPLATPELLQEIEAHVLVPTVHA